MRSKDRYKVGTRVQIVEADGGTFRGKLLMRDPHTEHTNKQGTIIEFDKEDGIPKIQLDDGTVLYGYECWWMPVEEIDAIHRELGIPNVRKVDSGRTV